jgi:hypothetical protein
VIFLPRGKLSIAFFRGKKLLNKAEPSNLTVILSLSVSVMLKWILNKLLHHTPRIICTANLTTIPIATPINKSVASTPMIVTINIKNCSVPTLSTLTNSVGAASLNPVKTKSAANAGKKITLDLTDAYLIDHTVLEFMHDFMHDYANNGGQCQQRGDAIIKFSDHDLAARIMTVDERNNRT